MPRSKKIRSRRVDFFENRADLRSVVLGSMGFSSSYISKVTGLSLGQIQYRLGKADVKRSDYRNGSSEFASFVMSAAESKLTSRVRAHVSEVLAVNNARRATA